MKRVIMLVAMLLVATFAVDASAQSSKLIGTWKSKDVSSLGADGVEWVEATFSFEADGKGESEMELKVVTPFDDVYTLKCECDLDIDLTWALSDNKLSMRFVGTDVDVDNLSISPYSAEYAELLPMLKEMFEEMLEKKFEKMFEKGLLEDGAMSNLDSECIVQFVDNNTLKFEGITFIRVR